MQTTPSPSPFPSQPAPVSADADLARDVALRLEHWYREHQLDLPPDVQAGFVEMGVEAVTRYPERPRDEVLDELLAELDASLSRIKAEPAPGTASGAMPATAPRRGWWRRLFDRDAH
ncbi:hypothetical protein [Lysobacter humi (ex Lee et al. 2017)]